MNTIDGKFSRRLRAVRGLMGLSQTELGNRVGCSHALISMIENCRVGVSQAWREKVRDMLGWDSVVDASFDMIEERLRKH